MVRLGLGLPVATDEDFLVTYRPGHMSEVRGSLREVRGGGHLAPFSAEAIVSRSRSGDGGDVLVWGGYLVSLAGFCIPYREQEDSIHCLGRL